MLTLRRVMGWKTLLLAMLGLRGCVGLSVVVASRDCFPVVVCRLLIAMSSLVTEHELWSVGSVPVVHRLSCPEACGTHVPCVSRWIHNTGPPGKPGRLTFTLGPSVRFEKPSQ